MPKFVEQKAAALRGQDLSRKGSVDEPIRNLVNFINSKSQYFTTSSCSGRILVLADQLKHDQEPHGIVKEGCKWVHVSHEKCSAEELLPKIDPNIGDMNFKFEAFVLHVQCETLDDAQIMLCAGVQAGFRNSGISLKSRKNPNQEWPKVITAIRSTHGLEAPLSVNGQMIVTNQYIEHLLVKANSLMDENLKRIARFEENLMKAVK